MKSNLVETITDSASAVGASTVAVATLGTSGGTTAVLSYQRLLDESARVAAGLVELGLESGDTVGVFLPNVSQWIVTELAAARLGLRIAPINTKFRSTEVSRILRVADVRAIVAASGFLHLDLMSIVDEALALHPSDDIPVIEVPLGAPSERPDVIPFDALGVGREPVYSLGPHDGEKALNLFFSSGTTSSPKSVAHGQAALLNRFEAAAKRFDIVPGDVVLVVLPVCGVWGLGISLAALIGGATVLLAPVFNADDIARAIGDHGVTHLHGGDDMVRAVLDAASEQPERVSTWRYATFGNFSGKDPADLVRPRRGMEQLEINGAYGSSEALAFVASDVPGATPAERASAGGPLTDSDTEALVVDPETGQRVGLGEYGELLLRGVSVAKEYIGNPEATADSFDEDGWFHTGDLVRMDADARLVFIGRLKDSLRLRGFLVDPGEIEEFLITVSGVDAAQVVGVVDPRSGDVPVAFIVPSEKPSPELELHIIEECRASLAGFKVPTAIVFVDEFPVVDGPNGAKIKRHELQERARKVIAS